jgi:protoporphyrinogen oxidase
MWHDMLTPDDFLTRPRTSRIYYGGKFYDYPLKPWNALRNLGPIEAVRCVLSYIWARVRPPRDQTSFEGYMAAQFGWRLYRKFFKTYTEKVWGVPASALQAAWAAQRIKNLNLLTAVRDAVLPRRGRVTSTSLIERFEYPRLGPGMMWERCADRVRAQGSDIRLSHGVERIRHEHGRATHVVGSAPDGEWSVACSAVVSSMPLPRLVQAMDPPAPPEVLEAADQITYRDFLTVALIVPESLAFPDNWIYIHSPDVAVGRIQNFGAWSSDMIGEPGMTCLGLEYFVFEGDELWDASDDDLIERATRELARLQLIPAEHVGAGYVVRMPKAYPMYGPEHEANVAIMRRWIEATVPNVHPVGRNGMHRYNNQDHSMFTAMLTVENVMLGTDHDVWSVNVESDYHEELQATPTERAEP